MTTTAGSSLGGAVYDRGYRPYEGDRGGRAQARAALFRLTVRRALGIRRSWKQKILPWSLLAVVTLPAVVNVGIRFATRDIPIDELEIQFISYRDYVGVSAALLLFLAVTAPDAVCPDRHDRVLPLLFARPLTGIDYVAAKVAALAAVTFGFSFLPQVVLYVGQMFVHEDGALDYLGDHLDVLWQVPAAVAVLAVYYAVVSVALASLTDRRLVGGVAILGLALITSVIAGVLTTGIDGTDEGGGSLWYLISVFDIPLVLRDVIFLGHVDPASGLGGVEAAGLLAGIVYAGVTAAGATVLFWRYREVKL